MKLICLGANNPETIRVVHAIKKKDKDFQLLGFIDNDRAKWGKDFFGYPVFGGVEKVDEFSKEGVVFCNVITRDCVTRYETSREMIKHGARLVNLIHPGVNLESVKVGICNYIQENVILQPGATIGDNCAINCGSIVSHECKIGDHSFLAPGCVLCGIIDVGEGVMIGAGSTILPRLKIGKWSVVGAGAVITRDVPPYSVVVGNPGKVIKVLDKMELQERYLKERPV